MVSVLFAPGRHAPVAASEPVFFGDLNLDQLVDVVFAGRDRYQLRPFFYTPLRDVEAVRFRHEVFRDLEAEGTRRAVEEFAKGMRASQESLAQAEKLRYREQKERWFLDAVLIYCRTITALSGALTEVDLQSRGLRELRVFLAGYVESAGFVSMVADARAVLSELADVRYTVYVRGARVTVGKPEEETDFSSEIADVFAKFTAGESKSYLAPFSRYEDMDHVEAQILRRVTLLFPEPFQALTDFSARYRDFVDETVARFDREIQFYLAFAEFTRRCIDAGLRFCYPEVSIESRVLEVADAFDVALAAKVLSDGGEVVCNDVGLTGRERILVVTGPNQGGKTTFARMIGQLHYLGSLGVPVPARRAQVFLPDRLFTHFEREESLATLRGKLEDELVRIHQVLSEASADSVIVMNESFTSTTLDDARFIGREVLEQITDLGATAVYVTFVDELAALNDTTVSMVAMIGATDPDRRTFKVVRRDADGLAYAAAVAAKYGLTYDQLRERVAA